MNDERFWILNYDEDDHRDDLLSGQLVCIVDEAAGGIIAYATNIDYAHTIIAALRRAVQ